MSTLAKITAENYALKIELEEIKADIREFLACIPTPEMSTQLWHEMLTPMKEKYPLLLMERLEEVEHTPAPFVTPATAEAIANELGAASVAASETPTIYDVFGQKEGQEGERVNEDKPTFHELRDEIRDLKAQIAALELDVISRQNKINRIKELL